MSQHRSLKSSKVGKGQRTVLKRYERFFTLKEKGVLKNGDSIFGMPKLKIVRTKIKKEKAEEKPEEAQVAPETAAEAGTAKAGTAKAGAAKPGAPSKEKGKEAASPKAEKEKGKK